MVEHSGQDQEPPGHRKRLLWAEWDLASQSELIAIVLGGSV